MITDFFLELFGATASAFNFGIGEVGSILTDAADWISGIVQDFFGLMVYLNFIIDMDVLFWAVASMVGLLLIALTFRVANWLFNHIPLIGSFG